MKPTLMRMNTLPSRLAALVAMAWLAACSGDPKPVITVFTATPDVIAKGGQATLVFGADQAKHLEIDNGVGDVTGQTQVTVSPTETTTYTLTATNGSKSSTAQVTVSVGPEASPKIAVFIAAPDAVVAGESTTLIFSVSGADKLEVDQGVGVVTGKTQIAVTPTDTTTYKLTATHGAQKVSATTTVTVNAKPTGGVKFSWDAPVVAGTTLPVTLTVIDTDNKTVTGFTGTVHLISNDAAATIPSDVAFTSADKGVKTIQATFKTAGPHVLIATGTLQNGKPFSSMSGPIDVQPGAATKLQLSGIPAQVTSGDSITAGVSYQDAFGNTLTSHDATLHVTLSDAAAPAVADVAVTSAKATFSASLFTAGVQTITVEESASLKTTVEVRVVASAAVALNLSNAPSDVIAGDPVSITATVVDAHGNTVLDYAGSAHVTSDDASDVVPADTAFNKGVAALPVSLRKAGPHAISVAAGALNGTVHIQVHAGAPVAFNLMGLGPTVAGVATSFRLTAVDGLGNASDSYRGTVDFHSTDAQATLPTSYTFNAEDGGAHTFTITFATAGTQSVTVTDSASPGLTATASTSVGASAAAACAITELPASAAAGTALAARVTVRDAFGNVADGYAGTVGLTSSDTGAGASLPSPTAFVPAADHGSRLFALSLVTAGNQTVTATDSSTAFTCSVNVNISPAALRLALTLPPDVNVGVPVTANVSLADAYGNVATAFTGTLHFTSSDGAAVLPADLTFTGTENGHGSASVTFNTLGAQSLTATQTSDATVTRTTTVNVHGLVYTDPQAGLGKVRLVLNAAKSSASVVQLDLVSNVTLSASGSATLPARGGAYAAGFNLPLDTTRAMADSTLLVEGNALNLGSAPKAVAAALPTSGPAANILLTGVSQKAAGAGAAVGDTSLTPGRIFYSVRLKLVPTAGVGTVFDGANLSKAFRAAVRARSGDDVISLPDFAIGKLEVR